MARWVSNSTWLGNQLVFPNLHPAISPGKPQNLPQCRCRLSGPSNRSIIPATCTTPPEVDNTADHVPTFQPPMQRRTSTTSPLNPTNSFSNTAGVATPRLLSARSAAGAPAPRVMMNRISGCSDVVDRSRPPNSPRAGLCQLHAGLTLGPVRNSNSSPGPGNTNPAWD